MNALPKMFSNSEKIKHKKHAYIMNTGDHDHSLEVQLLSEVSDLLFNLNPPPLFKIWDKQGGQVKFKKTPKSVP